MKTITLCPGDTYRGYWIEGDPGAGDGDAFIRVYRSKEEAEQEDTEELGAVVMFDGDDEKNDNGAYTAFVVSAEGLTEKNPRECGTAPTYLMALNLLIDELDSVEEPSEPEPEDWDSENEESDEERNTGDYYDKEYDI